MCVNILGTLNFSVFLEISGFPTYVSPVYQVIMKYLGCLSPSPSDNPCHSFYISQIFQHCPGCAIYSSVFAVTVHIQSTVIAS